MKLIFSLLLFIVFLIAGKNSFAQIKPDNKTNDGDKQSSLKIGADYSNNDVFLGRSDTVKTPAITAEIKYAFKNGIFLSANVNYIPNRLVSKLDGGSVAAGYDYDITDDFSGGVSYTKLFYSKNSTQIQSSISSTFNASFNYDIADIITPWASVDYNLVKQGFGNDVIVNAGLMHDFTIKGIFSENDTGSISPGAEVNAGTQNFYDAFLTLKKYRLKSKSNAANKLAKQQAKLSKFNLLDYEFSVPVEYKTGPLILSLTPTYTLAQNKLPAGITRSMVNSIGIFYFTAGAALKF